MDCAQSKAESRLFQSLIKFFDITESDSFKHSPHIIFYLSYGGIATERAVSTKVA